MEPKSNPEEELNELKGRFARLQLLYQVSGVIHSTLDPEEALQLIVDEAVRLAGASSGSTVLVNPKTGLLEIQAARGLSEEAKQVRLLVGEGITGWVARSGLPARVGDVAADPRYIMVRDGVRSELAVPLEVGGEVRGVLNVDSDRMEAFSAEHQELLEGLAAQSARVIQNTWLYEQLRLKVKLSESLINVSQVINSPLTLDDALNTITREAAQLMHARMCSLMLLDETGQWLDLRASHGAGPAYINKPRLHVNESLLGSVARRQKPLQVENVQTSNRYQHRDLARQEGLVSLLSVPLIYRSASIGTLSVYTSSPYRFANEEVRILSAFAEMSAIAIEKARVYERLVDVEEELRHREKLSALGLLAAEVAHEIRNPLTVLKMLYHSLDLRFPPEDPRAKDARIIDEKIGHLNKIVEQVLDFARATEPTFAPVNLAKLIDELCLLVRHKLKQQNVQVVRRLYPDLPEVPGESSQIEQALLNLILNAAEAMPQGGTLTLTTRPVGPHRSRSHPTHVAMDIQDTGHGMTEEFRKRAFHSLLQTTKSKGTGLGLAIVARVVETHHGKVKIKSRPGAGTTISIILPVDPAPAG
jgi:signal transduction histidine kinase